MSKPRAMATAVLLGAVLLGAALLGGCAKADQGELSPGSPGSVSAEPSVSPSGAPSLSPSGAPSLNPSAGVKPGERTIRGVVEPGVEGSCLLLTDADGTTYLLLGGDPRVLRAGATVVVQGRPQPGVASTCQQGTPFAVSSATQG